MKSNLNFDVDDWNNWIKTLKNFFTCYKISSTLFSDEKDLKRPFVSIKIYNLSLSGLLDSGSSITILGNKSYLEILKLGFKLFKSDFITVSTANNQKIKSLGYFDLPICFNNQTHLIKTYVLPEISPSLILGIDFWRKFNLLPSILSSASFSDFECSTGGVTTIRVLAYDHLPSCQRLIADDIIQKFRTISFEEKGVLGRTSLMSHRIDTGDSLPIKQRCYRLSPIKQKALVDEVDKMLKWDVIEQCESPWLSPVLITPKKNGEWRFCIDSRKLNSVTRRDAYSLPLISEILDNLKNAKYLSSIDIAKAFWEIPLNLADRDKTAFYVPGRGMFRFKVMPFGLTNSPATQQRLMDKLFTPDFDNKVFCYLDDIVIISETFEEHISLLMKVHEKLALANLTINFEKSLFFKKELKYLGFIVDEYGLRADPDKIKAILEYPTPTCRKEVRRFIGTCSWFRRFIPNFSSIASPLNKLTCSGKNAPKFLWNSDAAAAFQILKEALVTAPVLACPDFNLPFSVHCDASNYGTGAMLTQFQNDKEVVIAYMSKSLNKNQQNYSTTERETLAVITALEHWRCYLDNGREFTIFTDHAALKWFQNLSNPSGRLARWTLRLSCFNFVLKHKKGKDNIVPDLLSRSNVSPQGVHPISTAGPTLNRELEHYNKIFLGCRNNPDAYPNYTIRDSKLYRCIYSPHGLNDDFIWKEVPLPQERHSLVVINHGSNQEPHLGVFKTYKKLSLRYYWPGMFRDIANIISSCDNCLSYKHPNHSPYGPMGKPKICSRPFQSISLDLMGPLPMTRRRNMYILVINCNFTKYTMIFPLKRATASNIISILENSVFLIHGVPQTIIMDNGPQFQSRDFRSFVNRYKIPFIFYSPFYCPQVNPTERYNRTIITALASLVGEDHRSWDIYLPRIQFAMNSNVNAVTGFTPSFLVFGRETIPCGSFYTTTEDLEELVFLPRDIYATNAGLLSSIFHKVQTSLYTAHIKNSARYDLRRSCKEFNVGDTVWRKNYTLSNAGSYFSTKLAPKFIKCKVITKLSPLVYILEDTYGNKGKWHIKDIKSGPFRILRVLDVMFNELFIRKINIIQYYGFIVFRGTMTSYGLFATERL